MSPVVLIADHDRGICQALTRCLQQRGFSVSTAVDALQCLGGLREESPDVLVLDPELLWGGGNGVLEVLVEEEPLKRLTVIYLDCPENPPLPDRLQKRIDERIPRPKCLNDLVPCVLDLEVLIRRHVLPPVPAESPGECSHNTGSAIFNPLQ